jgi:hypothetical protein
MNKLNAGKKNTHSGELLEEPMRWVVPISIALMLVGCGVDQQINSSAQSLDTHNALASNALASNALASNALASNALASNALAANQLSSNRFTVTDRDLIETEDGREVLTYTVSCALPDGVTLTGTDSHGTQYEFPGELGLAPQWLDHPLTQAGKGWVSACLFARVNVHGVPVEISMRGPSSALAVSPDEQASWTLQEGAFYGNYFTAPGQPIDWNACRGRDSEQAQRFERACAQPDPQNPGKTLCGFNFAGDCGRYSTARTATACRAFSRNGYYVNCADAAIFAAGDDHADEGDDGRDDDQSRIFRQVITTFVHP